MRIELQNVVPIPLKERFSKRTSDVWNVNISFDETNRTKIKAPSGTGKTTLIHTIYKLRDDYEGNIFWNKNDLKKISSEELATFRQQNISIIFQDLRLFPNLTARENIELKRVLQKPFHEEKRIDEMAETLGITGVLEQRAGLCSYGEQQRIAIVRALIQPFELLLMDEPFSHLDQTNIQKAAKLIAEECTKRNAGFVLTDLDEDEHFEYSLKLNL